MSTLSKIRKLEQRRERLIGELLKTQAMIRGNFGTVYRKCGAPNCWCAQGSNGHPLDRINYSHDGNRNTTINNETMQQGTWYSRNWSLWHGVVVLIKFCKVPITRYAAN